MVTFVSFDNFIVCYEYYFLIPGKGLSYWSKILLSLLCFHNSTMLIARMLNLEFFYPFERFSVLSICNVELSIYFLTFILIFVIHILARGILLFSYVRNTVFLLFCWWSSFNLIEKIQWCPITPVYRYLLWSQ